MKAARTSIFEPEVRIQFMLFFSLFLFLYFPFSLCKRNQWARMLRHVVYRGSNLDQTNLLAKMTRDAVRVVIIITF